MTYQVKYSKYGRYLVINTKTGDAQSSWSDKMTAMQVASDLNKLPYRE